MAELNLSPAKITRIVSSLLIERHDWLRTLSGNTDSPTPYDLTALAEVAEIDDCLAALGRPVSVRAGSFNFQTAGA